jgi:hypothetical protein
MYVVRALFKHFIYINYYIKVEFFNSKYVDFTHFHKNFRKAYVRCLKNTSEELTFSLKYLDKKLQF